MSVPFKVDLKDKVAVVTGGGGILCGVMAKALAPAPLMRYPTASDFSAALEDLKNG